MKILFECCHPFFFSNARSSAYSNASARVGGLIWIQRFPSWKGFNWTLTDFLSACLLFFSSPTEPLKTFFTCLHSGQQSCFKLISLVHQHRHLGLIASHLHLPFYFIYICLFMSFFFSRLRLFLAPHQSSLGIAQENEGKRQKWFRNFIAHFSPSLESIILFPLCMWLCKNIIRGHRCILFLQFQFEYSKHWTTQTMTTGREKYIWKNIKFKYQVL